MTRQDCRFASLLGKSVCAVVHHRVKVVASIKVSIFLLVHHFKVRFVFWFNVVPLDGNKFVSVRVIVHVSVAKGMNQLVHDRADLETATTKEKCLRSSDPAKLRTATMLIRLDDNVIRLKRSCKKTNTSVTFNLRHSSSDVGLLIRS